MKQQDEIKLENLKRKYFWEQKTREVIFILIGILLVIFLIFMVGSVYLEFNPEGMNIGNDKNPSYITNIFAVGFFLSIFTLMIVGIFLAFFYLIYIIIIKSWIESNWERAEDRAKEDLKL
ncbi:hypothetical protein LCGC14_0476220 [marine sediment metagenome]|uniref:Uncharacterized protein n=1 Tax=marine sediment metagenome TaxID=412755 RepID=A0A0F9SFU2_9ZZZZ